MDLPNFEWNLVALESHHPCKFKMKALGLVEVRTRFKSIWESYCGQNYLDSIFFLDRKIATSILFTCRVLVN